MTPDAVVAEVRARALALGFDAFGITDAGARPEVASRLATALEAGWHAGMSWMAETAGRRSAVQSLWPAARSVIVLGMNYAPANDPMGNLANRSSATISVYARNRDYHDVIKGRLKDVAGLLARRAGAEVKVFVDTAPLMEKPLAEAAGLGWQGKHTVVVSREFGSWLFLGVILTDAELPPDRPHEENCGSCRRCLDGCPTAAFPAPFQLDARRCLAYYSVEHKGPIPLEFRVAMGNRIYGCDDCLAVCPWNKFASTSREARLRARDDLDAPDLAQLAQLDDTGFRTLFSGSPIKRIGVDRFIRNVLIAIGNSDDRQLIASAEQHLGANNPIVRGAAIWAFRRLADPDEVLAKRDALLPDEDDLSVVNEWLDPITMAVN